RGEINVEHPAWSILDVGAALPSATAFFSFQTIANTSCFRFQLVRIEFGGVCVDSMPRMSFDHSPQLLIATDSAKLDVGEPLPRCALFRQIFEKAFRTRD